MYEIDRLPNSIDIGFTGEHKFRTIEIDMTSWMSKIPNGTPYIIHIKPGGSDADSYIAATTFSNNILTWEITETDLGTAEGVGKAQVWLEETQSGSLDLVKRGMSKTFVTLISKCVGSGNPGEPTHQADWEAMLEDTFSRAIAKPQNVPGGKFLQTDSGGTAVWGDPASAAQIVSAAEAWLSEHVSQGTTLAIDDTLQMSGYAADAKAAGDRISNVEDAFIKTTVVTKSLTNAYNISNFNSNYAEEGYGNGTFSSNILSLTNDGGVISPYVVCLVSKGSGKWLVGFKFKFTKLDISLADPEQFRVWMGADRTKDFTPVWGEWLDYHDVATIDFTRIRLAARNFATAPAASKFKLEIKDLYIYNVADVSDELLEHIISEQSSNFTDGTVTYTIGGDYVPDTTLAISGKAADSKAVGDAISRITPDGSLSTTSENPIQNKAITNAFREILALDGEQATVTNLLNVSGFKTGITARGNFDNGSVSDGVATFKTSGSTETSPYMAAQLSAGTKHWLVGFKYKVTKLNQNAGTPECVRIHLGTTPYDFDLDNGNWKQFSKNVTLDLTRIRIALPDFASAPAANDYQVDIKEMYLYDATDLSLTMCSYITSEQSTDYTDGTVTFDTGSGEYKPDTSLGKSGKAADSKAVGDAIKAAGDGINVKYYGVKGNGTDDDTDAINALFADMAGDFYFPAGIYKISGTLVLPAKSSIHGDGDTSIIDMYSCDNLEKCVFRSNDYIYPYILTTGDHTRFHDFKLIGNSTTDNKRHGGICVIGAEDCLIDSVTISDINYVDDQTDPPTAKGYGIAIIGSSKAYIDHCYVEKCGYECIGICDKSHHCVVKNCIAKNGWRTCMQIHRGAHDVIFRGNYLIQDSETQEWDACFTLHGLSGDDLVTNLRIEDNVFRATATPRYRAENYAAVVQLMSYCDGLWFVNNRVEAGDRGVYSSDTNSHLTMIGNLIQCSETSDYRVKIYTANPIIVGNVVENVSSGQVVVPASAVLAGNIGF